MELRHQDVTPPRSFQRPHRQGGARLLPSEKKVFNAKIELVQENSWSD